MCCQKPDMERERVCVCMCMCVDLESLAKKKERGAGGGFKKKKKRLLCVAYVEQLAETLPTEADMIACISYRVDELLILNIGMYIIRLPMDIFNVLADKTSSVVEVHTKIGVMITVPGSTKLALCIVQCPFLHQKNTKKSYGY